MESARPVELGFFPLDEQLHLVAGGLSPRSQDHLTHLTVWMPFQRAVQMLAKLTGVHISEATARRYSYQIGKAAVAVQQEQVCHAIPVVAEAVREEKLIISADGAMVSLLKGQWAEVKTLAIECVEPSQTDEPVHSSQLSYFSRMLDVATFTEQATTELLRRGVDQAKEVCAVMDGAQWIDGFVDWQRVDARRILDFAHAAEYISEIGQLAQAAGACLPQDWLQTQLHDLKHAGPAAVKRLRDLFPHVEGIGKKLVYLQKRAQGWPIGSGIVESGNKVVMQVRLKGAGMHWAPEHVNPMLALRTSACNDRWDETSQHVSVHLNRELATQKQHRQAHRADQLLQCIQICVLFWQSRLLPPVVPALAKRSGSTRPSATHPWRRQLLAKK